MKLGAFTLIIICSAFLLSCGPSNHGKIAKRDSLLLEAEKRTSIDKKEQDTIANMAVLLIDTVGIDTVIEDPTIYPCNFFDESRFRFRASDTIDLRAEAFAKFNYHGTLSILSNAEKQKFLQHSYKGTDTSSYYFYSIINCMAKSKSVVLLSYNNDDWRILLLVYNDKDQLISSTTLLESYGDGQASLNGFVTFNQKEHRFTTTEILTETLEDGNVNMAEMVRRVVHERYLYPLTPDSINNLNPGRYKVGVDTKSAEYWINSWPTNNPKQLKRQLLTTLIPKERQVKRMASGDLNGDDWADHVFVLDKLPLDRNMNRDLMIIFMDGNQFIRKAYFKGFLGAANTAGMYDPVIGIAIHDKQIVIRSIGASDQKYEEINTYVYSDSLDNFSLVKYHFNPYEPGSFSTLDEDIAPYNDMIRYNRPFSAEDEKEYKRLKKIEENFPYKAVSYPIGKYPMKDGVQYY